MDRHAIRVWGCAVASLAVAALGHCGEINITRTNKFDRWITNLIEVRMPENHFVNEYRTNWVTQIRTNIIDFYATNIVTRTATNRVEVDAFQTNYVVNYHTNIQTINVTNWQTAVVIKTNLSVQPVTTVVEVSARPAATPPLESNPPSTTSLALDGLVIEATRAGRPGVNGQIEVTLTARDPANAGSPVQIQQWRVEREDGAILSFGQEQDFKRELPVGRYKLEIKGQRNSDIVSSKALLEITPKVALLQQRLTAKR